MFIYYIGKALWMAYISHNNIYICLVKMELHRMR